MAAQGTELPGYVQRGFDDYLKDGVYVDGAESAARCRLFKAPQAITAYQY
jgi:hypothetical protein